MKLLILTQKVDQNDDVLGFFHRWLEEFARGCEKVTVVALQVGSYQLPANVRVYSLGKEQGISRFSYLTNFYRIIWEKRHDYDAVFVHMNPIYVVLAGLYWRLVQKKVALWYTHKHVDFKLRLAEKLVGKIFTASAKSFRLPSSKVLVTGHGIDTTVFAPRDRREEGGFRILTIGRLSRVKDYDTLLHAAEILKTGGVVFLLELIGDPVTSEDRAYATRLKQRVRELKLEQQVLFRGAISHRLLPLELANADVFVNLSKTGSVDKAVLEAMSMGLPIVTANEAFQEVLGTDKDFLMVPSGDAEVLAAKLKKIAEMSEKERKVIGQRLRELVMKHHDLTRLIPLIVQTYESFS